MIKPFLTLKIELLFINIIKFLIIVIYIMGSSSSMPIYCRGCGASSENITINYNGKCDECKGKSTKGYEIINGELFESYGHCRDCNYKCSLKKDTSLCYTCTHK